MSCRSHRIIIWKQVGPVLEYSQGQLENEPLELYYMFKLTYVRALYLETHFITLTVGKVFLASEETYPFTLHFCSAVIIYDALESIRQAISEESKREYVTSEGL